MSRGTIYTLWAPIIVVLLLQTRLASGQSCPSGSCSCGATCYKPNQYKCTGGALKEGSETGKVCPATPTPTPTPKATPTPAPTAKATPAPTAKATPAPTAKATPAPTTKPTPSPTTAPCNGTKCPSPATAVTTAPAPGPLTVSPASAPGPSALLSPPSPAPGLNAATAIIRLSGNSSLWPLDQVKQGAILDAVSSLVPQVLRTSMSITSTTQLLSVASSGRRRLAQSSSDVTVDATLVMAAPSQAAAEAAQTSLSSASADGSLLTALQAQGLAVSAVTLATSPAAPAAATRTPKWIGIAAGVAVSAAVLAAVIACCLWHRRGGPPAAAAPTVVAKPYTPTAAAPFWHNYVQEKAEGGDGTADGTRDISEGIKAGPGPADQAPGHEQPQGPVAPSALSASSAPNQTPTPYHAAMAARWGFLSGLVRGFSAGKPDPADAESAASPSAGSGVLRVTSGVPKPLAGSGASATLPHQAKGVIAVPPLAAVNVTAQAAQPPPRGWVSRTNSLAKEAASRQPPPSTQAAIAAAPAPQEAKPAAQPTGATRVLEAPALVGGGGSKNAAGILPEGSMELQGAQSGGIPGVAPPERPPRVPSNRARPAGARPSGPSRR